MTTTNGSRPRCRVGRATKLGASDVFAEIVVDVKKQLIGNPLELILDDGDNIVGDRLQIVTRRYGSSRRSTFGRIDCSAFVTVCPACTSLTDTMPSVEPFGANAVSL